MTVRDNTAVAVAVKGNNSPAVRMQRVIDRTSSGSAVVAFTHVA